MAEQLRVPEGTQTPDVSLPISNTPPPDEGGVVASAPPAPPTTVNPDVVLGAAPPPEVRPPAPAEPAPVSINLGSPTAPDAGTKLRAGTLEPAQDEPLPGEKSLWQVAREQLGFDGLQRLAEAWLPDDRPEKAAVVNALKPVDTLLGVLNILPAEYSNVALKNLTRSLREAGYTQDEIASIVAVPDAANQLLSGLLYGGLAGQPSTAGLRDLARLATATGAKAEAALRTLRRLEGRTGRAAREIAVDTHVWQAVFGGEVPEKITDAQYDVISLVVHDLARAVGHTPRDTQAYMRVGKQLMDGLKKTERIEPLWNTVERLAREEGLFEVLRTHPIRSEAGVYDLAVPLVLGRAVIGATLGAATVEESEARLKAALVGAGLGAIASPALVRKAAQLVEPYRVKLPEPGSAPAKVSPKVVKQGSILKGVEEVEEVDIKVPRLARPYEYGPLETSARRLIDAVVARSSADATAQLDALADQLDVKRLPKDPRAASAALHKEMVRVFEQAWDAARGSITIQDVREVASALGLDDLVQVMEGGTASASALSAPEFWALTAAYRGLMRKAAKILKEDIEGAAASSRLAPEKIEEAYQAVRVASELWARRQAGLSEGARVMRMAQEDIPARRQGKFLEGLITQLARNELDEASIQLKLEVVRAAAATETPAETATFFSTLYTRLGGGFRLTYGLIQDAWKSALLTGFRGAVTNVTSSLALAVERPLALGLAAGWGLAKRAVGTLDVVGAAKREVTGAPPGFVYASEVPAYAFGFLTAIPDAILSAGRVAIGNPSRFGQDSAKFAESAHRAWEAWKSIQNPVAKLVLAPPMAVAEGVGSALRGIARVLVLAPDEFVRTASYSAVVYQRAMHDAINAAKATGGKASFADVAARVLKTIKDPTPAMDQIARAQAEVFTYASPHVGDYGGVLASFSRWGSHPVLGWVFPFARAMANAILTQVEHIPGGHLVSPRAQKILDMGGEAERQVYAVQGVIGLTLLMSGAALAQTGRLAHWMRETYKELTGEEPPEWTKTALRIEGSGPLHPSSKKAWREAGGKPNVMYLPGHPEGFALERLGHVGRFLALGAEIADAAAQSQESHDIVEQFLAQVAIPLATLAVDPTFAGPIRDLVEAGFSGNPDDLRKFVQGYARSLVPTGVRQIEGLGDPELRAEWDRTLTWVENLWQTTKSQIPGWSESVDPRLDQWGDPMLSPEGWLPFDVPKGTEWLTLLAPAVGVKKLQDPATVEIIVNQMGISRPDPVLYGPAPGKYGIEDPRAGIPLSVPQWNRYIKLQGNELKLPVGKELGAVFGVSMPDKVGRHDLLNALARSTFYGTLTPGPAGTRADVFRAITRQYRELAEYALLAEFPEIARAYQEQFRERILAKFGPAAAAGLPSPETIADQLVREVRVLVEALR